MKLNLILPYAWDTSPCQRFRIEQWAPFLRDTGVELRISALMTRDQQKILHRSRSTVRKAILLAKCFAHRWKQINKSGDYDAIWLHRSAFLIGPPFFERRLVRLDTPVILEFDDAIYLSDTADVNRKWSFLKNSSKTDGLCRMADHVVVGNPFLADYARQFNDHVSVIPTTIDTDLYVEREPHRDRTPVVIGWSGSTTTAAHLHLLDRVLQRVAEQVDVKLHVVGTDNFHIEGVDVRTVDWTPDIEIPELQDFDIGLMPLPDEEWAKGKCALKALQYMAVGVPTITSPVGVNADIIKHGENGLLATTEDQWVEQIVRLVKSAESRERLGRAGRQTVVEGYSHHVQAPRVLQLLKQITGMCEVEASPAPEEIVA